ncbi:MAG: hypothetical protein AB8G86_19170 [Saprospiraceae bacterium]
MNNSKYTKIAAFLIAFSFSLIFHISAYCSIVVINGLTHIHEANNGEIVRGVIEIQNTGFETRAVRVYQKDYLFSHSGEVFYNEPNSNPRSNAQWIDFSPSYLELAPQQKTVINYEITIPTGQELTGSYWSVLMVEGILPIAPELPKNGLNISTIMRYAVQVATNIGASGTHNLEFIEAKLDKIDGNPVGSVALVNSGERLLMPEVSIELFNEEGQSVSIVKTTKKKIYPGTSTRFFLDLGDLPEGTYQAVVLADCSEEDVFGLNLSLALGDD